MAVQYINHMGGTRSQVLCHLAIELWEWCLDRQITLHAEPLPGSLNFRADFESRHHINSSDWRLHHQVFNVLNQQFGPFSTDLFTSFQNTHLEHYFSWKPDPQAAAVDALSQPWSKLHPYAFPPFALIGRCLQKVREEKLDYLLLIAPVWPAQSWYPLLLEMLVEIPSVLPQQSDILLNPQGELHPLVVQNHLTLAAWPVSGNSSRQVAFQKMLKEYTVHPGGEAHQNHMNQHGESDSAGVVQGKVILFKPLFTILQST